MTILRHAANTSLMIMFALIAPSQAEPPGQSASSSSDWRPLFDGRTLDGWEHVGPGEFVVADGVLRTDGGMGLLWYSREKHSGTLRHSGQSRQDGQNRSAPILACYLRISRQAAPSDAWYAVHHGFEIQVMDQSTSGRGTGSIYTFAKAAGNPPKSGEWNTLEITLKGNRISTAINGVQAADFDSSGLKPDAPEISGEGDPARGPRPESGYIGLQNHDKNSIVYFKDVSVGPLPGSSK